MATDASSGSGGPTGRVVVEGRDRGAGFGLGGRLVVTANHVVRDRGEQSIAFVPVGGQEIGVSKVEGDDVLDVAVLELEREVERTLPIARASGQPAWRVETRPKKSDPVLSGRVIDTARLVVNAGGQEIELVQLHVDQQLGDYGGYSGSPVVLDSPRDAVIGVLVEQQRWRLGAPSGQPAPAANVLYATAIDKVVARFAIEESVLLGHPQRFDVPRPPSGLVERPVLLDQLLGSLDTPGAGVILVRGMPGMGKTVLSRKAAHHSRTWRAYPGGIVEHVVGEEGDADEVLNRLRARLSIGTGALADAFSDDSTLLILDDVWSPEVIGTLRENLPDAVTLLATTRGVRIKGAAVVRVDELTPEEAIELLARANPGDPELDAALGRLAHVLGRWPLLVDLAARHLHSDDLLGEEGLADVDQGVPQAVGPMELARRADAMATAFEGDPTVLDEADSRRRSFDRVLRRSLERLSVKARGAFADLAVYPADADLGQSLLADLWQLDPIRTEKTTAALARVGLATLVRVAPPTLRLHDLITTWLHQQYGSPEDPAHNELHRRCARPAITPDGAPGDVTEDRAAWLAFHLCRTDTLADPAALLRITWRSAYRAGAGSDALYLAALREIARHYATRLGASPVDNDATRGQLTAWTLKAALFHAHLSALVGEIPAAALATQALLGQPEAASHQAASNPNQDEAGAALYEIFITLHDHGSLAPQILDLITRLVQGLPDRIADEILAKIVRVLASTDPDAALTIAESIRRAARRDWALAGISQALAATDPDRALVIAERISDATSRGDAFAEIAEQLTLSDPDRALATAEHIPDQAEVTIADPGRRVEAGAHFPFRRAFSRARLPGLRRGQTLAAIAQTFATSDPDRGRRAFHQARRALDRALAASEEISSTFGERSSVLTGIAQTLVPIDATYARRFLDRALTATDAIFFERSQALTDIARVLGAIDPERARDVLDRALVAAEISFPSDRLPLLIDVAQAMVRVDPAGVRSVLERAIAPDRTGHVSEQTASVLRDIEHALTAVDEDSAPGVLERAIEAAAEIYYPEDQSTVSADIASALSASDADRAMAIAEHMRGELRSRALAEIARALLGTDFDRALAIAEQIPDKSERSRTLAELARTLVPSDSERARHLLDSAIAVAEVLPAQSEDDDSLDRILRALAPADPDRAVAIAERTPVDWVRSRMLTGIAEALTPIDSSYARRVLEHALAIAEQLPDSWSRDTVLRGIALAFVDIDAERALGIAEQVPHEFERHSTRAEIGRALAPTDPDRARRLFDSALAGTAQTSSTTVAPILQALAPTDPDRALAIAEQLSSKRGEALAGIAQALAPIDPERALAIAEQIRNQVSRGSAMAAIAAPLLRIDPDRALAIPKQIPRTHRSMARAEIAIALAATDFHHAVAVTRQIADELERAKALGHLAGRSTDGALLLAGLPQTWYHVGPAVRFAEALILSQRLTGESLEVVGAAVFHVLEWFPPSHV